MSFPAIDVHAHFLPDFYRDALEAAGHSASGGGLEEWPEWSVKSHLGFMRTNTIRKSYLSISAPGTFLESPSDNKSGGESSALQAARRLTRQVNEYGSSLKQEYPEQFGFFACLPLPDIDASLEELDSLQKTNKYDGIVMLSNTSGIYPGDPILDRVYARLNEMKAIVFIHPNTPSSIANLRTIPPPSLQPGDQDPTALHPAFTFDSTKAFANILTSNTATRHPDIKWLIPHCAFALPSLLPRIILTSQSNPLPSNPSSASAQSPLNAPLTEESLKTLLNTSFYFDLAGIPMSSRINDVLKWVDLTRFVFGSDVPFTDWRLAGQLGTQVREELLRIFGMETGVHECMRVCHGNAEALFGLGRKL